MINSVVAFGLMVIELLAAELVFAHFLERRPLFYVRLVGAAVICIVAALWTEFLYAVATGRDFTYEGVSGWQDSLFKFVYYIFVFALTICAVKYCYRGDIWTVVFYCSGGYALQHIAWNISAAVGLIPSVRRVFSEFAWLPFLCEVALCAAVYCAVYFFAIRRRTAPDETKDIKGKAVLFLAVILICIGLSRMTTDNPGRDMLSALAETLGAVVNCVFILAILFDVTDRDKARSEVQIMKEMMRREKEQYRLSKENIDLINIKCHDLKHQIQALRENASEQYIKKIEDAVMFYDSVAKTGNDVLDVILTEKTLLCEQNRIKFTCVARGEDLSFMDEMDIYSLFGNALTNAVESVLRVKDEDKRCVSLNVRTDDRILSVHIENFYEGEMRFEGGLPVTTKQDTDYHGFGMKSMDYIAKRYNGYMSVSAEDGIFSLDFVFPLPEKGGRKVSADT